MALLERWEETVLLGKPCTPVSTFTEESWWQGRWELGDRERSYRTRREGDSTLKPHIYTVFLTTAFSYPVCEEYTFCSHLFPENAMCLVFIMTTWSPQSPGFQKKQGRKTEWKHQSLKKRLDYLVTTVQIPHSKVKITVQHHTPLTHLFHLIDHVSTESWQAVWKISTLVEK